MDLCGSRGEIVTMRWFKWLLLVGVLTSLAVAQDAGNTAPVDAAKPAASATPDNPSKPPSGIRSDSYVIGAEDVLSIYVWKEPDFSRTVPVRPDGMISLPLLGEIKAVGSTPVQLQDILAQAMKKYVSDPQVTVMVDRISSLNFNIVGNIGRAGYFPLTHRMTVLDAIAMAGGFKDFAKTKKIYVLRKGPSGAEERIPFNYNAVIKGNNPQQNIELQPGDTIVVP